MKIESKTLNKEIEVEAYDVVTEDGRVLKRLSLATLLGIQIENNIQVESELLSSPVFAENLIWVAFKARATVNGRTSERVGSVQYVPSDSGMTNIKGTIQMQNVMTIAHNRAIESAIITVLNFDSVYYGEDELTALTPEKLAQISAVPEKKSTVLPGNTEIQNDAKAADENSDVSNEKDVKGKTKGERKPRGKASDNGKASDKKSETKTSPDKTDEKTKLSENTEKAAPENEENSSGNDERPDGTGVTEKESGTSEDNIKNDEKSDVTENNETSDNKVDLTDEKTASNEWIKAGDINSETNIVVNPENEKDDVSGADDKTANTADTENIQKNSDDSDNDEDAGGVSVKSAESMTTGEDAGADAEVVHLKDIKLEFTNHKGLNLSQINVESERAWLDFIAGWDGAMHKGEESFEILQTFARAALDGKTIVFDE